MERDTPGGWDNTPRGEVGLASCRKRTFFAKAWMTKVEAQDNQG